MMLADRREWIVGDLGGTSLELDTLIELRSYAIVTTCRLWFHNMKAAEAAARLEWSLVCQIAAFRP